MRFFDWLLDQPIDHIGNAIFIFTFLWVALCMAWGHRSGQINLWDCITSTDRRGLRRTDGAKLFIAGAFFVMTVTFYYLCVTKQLSEWYVLIYAAAWVGERFRSDLMKLKGLAIPDPKEKDDK
jgi:hypothetical protein